MQFLSTNRQCPPASFKEAVMTGLAPDGGLYMPEHIPVIPRAFFNNIGEMSIGEIAYIVATTVLGEDIDPAELKQIVFDTFTFDIPLRKLDSEIHALELFHGPTLGFKDVGSRFLARIISHYTRPTDKIVNVLIATSGDSGGAVASGFHKVPGVRVFVLYPERGLSHAQRNQFSSLGDNIYPIEIIGTFDDCQRVVREAFGDKSLRDEIRLTSANSINVCRLLPQMFYYFYGYSQLLRNETVPSDGIVISVPCGNLGNLTAGLLAMRMGLPVKRFVAANNDNDSFTRYLTTGIFSPQRPVHTIARAIDVGNPANIDRITDLYGGDIKAAEHEIHGLSFTETEIADAMRDVYNRNGYIMDPHGATAYVALREDLEEGEKGIFLATAHPAKYPVVISRTLGIDIEQSARVSTGEPPRHSPTPRISPSLPALRKLLLQTA